MPQSDWLAQVDNLPQDWALVSVSKNKRPYNPDHPQGREWQKNPLPRERFKTLNGKFGAVGLLLGPASNGLVAIDHDGHSATTKIEELSGLPILQALPMTVGFTSGRPGRYQVVYQVPEQYWEAICTRKILTGIKDPISGKDELVEFRWKGAQSVILGHHPDTDGYLWMPSRAPWEITVAECPTWVIEQMLDETPPHVNAPRTEWRIERPLERPIPLAHLLTKEHAILVEDGAVEGQRNDDGAALARDLIGCENWARLAGVNFEGSAQELFWQFADRSGLPGRESKTIWRSAERDNPGPARSDDGLKAAVKWWEKQHKAKVAAVVSKSIEAEFEEVKSEVMESDLVAEKIAVSSELASVKKALLEPLIEESERVRLKQRQIDLQERKSALTTQITSIQRQRTHDRINRRTELAEESGEKDERTQYEKDYDQCFELFNPELDEPRLRFNKLTMKIELDGTGVDLDETRTEISRRTGVKRWYTSDSSVLSIVKYLAKENSYCPIVDYLVECRAKHFDVEHTYLDDLAEELFGVTSAVQKAYFKATLIGAARRALYPGCEHTYMLILHSSGQGIGKSNALRELFGKEFFGEGQITLGDTDSILSMSQSWAFEIPECDEIFKTSTSSKMKAFITLQDDTYREPYGRSSGKHPRRTVLLGTTNHREFLSDSTGNRRFAIIDIPDGFQIDLEKIRKLRGKIWAAADHGRQMGVPNAIPEELYKAAHAESMEFMQIHPWEDLLRPYVAEQTGFRCEDLLVNPIKKEPGHWAKADKTQLIKCMTNLGFTYKRRDLTDEELTVFNKTKEDGERPRGWFFERK